MSNRPSASRTSKHAEGAASQPWIRKRLRWMATAVLLMVAAIAACWEPIQNWREREQVRQLFYQYRDAEALSLLRQMLLRSGNDPETLLQTVRAHRRLGDSRKALLLIEAARSAGAAKNRVELEQKLLAVQAGQIRGFDKEFPDLLAASGDDGPDIFQAYILGLSSNLRTDEAFSLLSGWQNSSPGDPLPHFLEGYLLQGINRLKESIEAYRRGLAMAPYLSSMRLRMAKALFEAGEYQQAKKELLTCRKEGADPVDVSLHLAKCERAVDDSGAALAELDRLFEIAPQHPEARRIRGQIHLANQENEKAIADLQMAIQLAPDDLVAHEALGRGLQAIGKHDEARKLFDYFSAASKEQSEIDRLIRQVLGDPQNVAMRLEIGLRLLQKGASEDGVKWLRTALELDPENAAAHAALSEYFTRVGDSTAAAYHRQKATNQTGGQ